MTSQVQELIEKLRLAKSKSSPFVGLNFGRKKPSQNLQEIFPNGTEFFYAAPIVASDVLRECEYIKNGDPMEMWFVIWNDRYTLRGDLRPIADYLESQGVTGASVQLDAWQERVRNNPESYYQSHFACY